MLRDGKVEGIVTDFSVHLIIVLVDRFKKLEELKIFLLSLTAYKGLYVYTTSIADEVKSVEATEENELDIDDAIQYVAALSINADSIISFDKDFDNLKIPRREPAKIMEDAHTNMKFKPQFRECSNINPTRGAHVYGEILVAPPD